MQTKDSKLTAIDLFAGIGGLRLGFEKAGFKIIYSNDSDKHCCTTYQANFGDIDSRDIREVNIDEIPRPDVLLAGFPCQPFSMIGKRLGLEDARGTLFFEIVKILSVKQPRAFVLENVRHLLKHDGGRTFERMKESLAWAGYKVFWQILDSQNFGVAQHRERLYMVGFKNNRVEFEFPSPNKRVLLRNILESEADESFYLSEKYYRGLLQHKRRHRANGSGFGCEILDPDGVSNTLVSGNMGRERNLIRDIPVKKNRWGVRKLTVRECARLQGFPNSFYLPVPMTAAYKQLGNAVTVPVAQAVARKVHATIKGLGNGPFPSAPSHAALDHIPSPSLEKTSAA